MQRGSGNEGCEGSEGLILCLRGGKGEVQQGPIRCSLALTYKKSVVGRHGEDRDDGSRWNLLTILTRQNQSFRAFEVDQHLLKGPSIIDMDLVTTPKTRTIKVLIIGPQSVGKTALRQRFLDERFVGLNAGYRATIGADFLSKRVIDEGENVLVSLWDTAGTLFQGCSGGSGDESMMTSSSAAKDGA